MYRDKKQKFVGCLGMNRVLGIQSQSKEADVQKRVLQTMVMVVTWKSCEMKEDTVAQVIGHEKNNRRNIVLDCCVFLGYISGGSCQGD